MSTGTEVREDKAFVEAQGLTVTLLNKDRARATWYRADGKALPNLPTDMYHRTRYRQRGWTLVPPLSATSSPSSEKMEMPVAAVMPVRVEQTVETPPVAAPPPTHMHVMREALGSSCLVEGCLNVRQRPPVAFQKKSLRNRRKVKETSHAR